MFKFEDPGTNAEAEAVVNIWVAASDGEVEKVQRMIEADGLSPVEPDENGYTPL